MVEHTFLFHCGQLNIYDGSGMKMPGKPILFLSGKKPFKDTMFY